MEFLESKNLFDSSLIRLANEVRNVHRLNRADKVQQKLFHQTFISGWTDRSHENCHPRKRSNHHSFKQCDQIAKRLKKNTGNDCRSVNWMSKSFGHGLCVSHRSTKPIFPKVYQTPRKRMPWLWQSLYARISVIHSYNKWGWFSKTRNSIWTYSTVVTNKSSEKGFTKAKDEVMGIPNETADK